MSVLLFVSDVVGEPLASSPLAASLAKQSDSGWTLDPATVEPFATVLVDHRSRLERETVASLRAALEDHPEVDAVIGFGDSGFGLRGFEYSTILTAGGLVRIHDSGNFELGLGGEILFERWDRHAATADIAEFALAEETSVDLRIEWFELDGAATLSFDVERLGD